MHPCPSSPSSQQSSPPQSGSTSQSREAASSNCIPSTAISRATLRRQPGQASPPSFPPRRSGNDHPRDHLTAPAELSRRIPPHHSRRSQRRRHCASRPTSRRQAKRRRPLHDHLRPTTATRMDRQAWAFHQGTALVVRQNSDAFRALAPEGLSLSSANPNPLSSPAEQRGPAFPIRQATTHSPPTISGSLTPTSLTHPTRSHASSRAPNKIIST